MILIFLLKYSLLLASLSFAHLGLFHSLGWVNTQSKDVLGYENKTAVLVIKYNVIHKYWTHVLSHNRSYYTGLSASAVSAKCYTGKDENNNFLFTVHFIIPDAFVKEWMERNIWKEFISFCFELSILDCCSLS